MANNRNKRLLDLFMKDEFQRMDLHKISLEELSGRYSSDLTKGLTTLQAAENLTMFGKNTVTKPTRSFQELFTFIGGLCYALCWSFAVFMGFMSFFKENASLADKVHLGICLFLIVIIAKLFYFYQRSKSLKFLEITNNLLQWAKVIRDGQLVTIKAEELTKGDIVEVKYGDRIPADIRIISCQDFKVDNSQITGKRDPEDRSPECTDTVYLDTKNVAFFSTTVVEGFCRGIVINVGDRTLLGKASKSAPYCFSCDTPITKEISENIDLIIGNTTFMFVTAIAIGFGLGYARYL